MMDDTFALPATQPTVDDDDDPDSPFSFLPDGPVAIAEQLANAEVARKAAEKVAQRRKQAQKLAREKAEKLKAVEGKKRKRSDQEAKADTPQPLTPGSRSPHLRAQSSMQPPTKKPSPNKPSPAMRPARVSKTPMAMDDDPFASPPSPALATSSLSPVPSASPIKRSSSPCTPQLSRLALSARGSPASPAKYSPNLPPHMQLPPTSSGLVRTKSDSAAAAKRTAPSPNKGFVALPAHVAASLGISSVPINPTTPTKNGPVTAPRRPPVRSPVRSASSTAATPHRASASPPAASTTTTASSLPPSHTSPSLGRSVSLSDLCQQRVANLAQKSNSTLLIEALLGRNSRELRAVQDASFTPAQRLQLCRPGMSAAHAPPLLTGIASPVKGGPQLAATLWSQATGARIKAKRDEGVGNSAKQRNRGRRTDGYLADMTPLLERTVQVLLDAGADPNVVDADGNRPLWLALQLKGAERVVKMLLDKGATCVDAMESEDESSEEEDEDAEVSADAQAARAQRVAMQEYEAKENMLPTHLQPLQLFRPATPQTLRAIRKQSQTTAAQGLGVTGNAALTSTSAAAAPGSSTPIAADPFGVERGSTVDLAIRIGSASSVQLLLRAGHLPRRPRMSTAKGPLGAAHRAASTGAVSLMPTPTPSPSASALHTTRRVRLHDFAVAHGFGQEADDILARALFEAAQEGGVEKAADVIAHMDLKKIDTRETATGRTALYFAVEARDPCVPLVSLLLRAGANPNATDVSNTPCAVFPICRQSKKAMSVLNLLLRHGLDLHAQVPDTEDVNASGSGSGSVGVRQDLLEWAEHVARPETVQLLKQAVEQRQIEEQERQKRSRHLALHTQIGTKEDPFMSML